MKATSAIGLTINTSTGFGRGLLHGVARYTKKYNSGTLLLEPIGFGMPSYKSTLSLADGIIARITSHQILQTINELKVPVINISDAIPGLPFPQVVTDHEKIGRLAGEHLIACGFRKFGFCGFQGESYSIARQSAFTETLTKRGFSCEIYNGKSDTTRSLQDEITQIAYWLKNFSEPVGVFACNDWRGQHLLIAAMTADISVPAQLAVLGVDNDELICAVCPTPLSSINSGAEAIGYRAAELLHRWMEKDEHPPMLTKESEVSVISRQSSDILQFSDPIVQQALNIMHTSNPLPRTINEILKDLPISRRPFEKRFLKAVGITPHEALARYRAERAADLLRTTDLLVQDIAERCGFSFGHHFAAAFRHIKGLSPNAYRKHWS